MQRDSITGSLQFFGSCDHSKHFGPSSALGLLGAPASKHPQLQPLRRPKRRDDDGQ